MVTVSRKWFRYLNEICDKTNFFVPYKRSNSRNVKGKAWRDLAFASSRTGVTKCSRALVFQSFQVSHPPFCSRASSVILIQLSASRALFLISSSSSTSSTLDFLLMTLNVTEKCRAGKEVNAAFYERKSFHAICSV